MPVRPPEDGQCVVHDGEWVGSIAVRYGYVEWDQDIWQHEKNSDLRQRRGDPHVLAPGDVLYIPPFDPKYEPGATEQRHKFQLKVPTEVLRIRFLRPDGTPLKNEDYLLNIETGDGGGVFTQRNKKTDGNGLLEEAIPSSALAGTLKFTRLHQAIQLRLGYLYPMDFNDKPKLILGTQQRLKWLGFYTAEIEPDEGPELESALRAFQQFCKDNAGKGDERISDAGPVDGTLSQQTRDALVKFYGS